MADLAQYVMLGMLATCLPAGLGVGVAVLLRRAAES